MVAHANQDHLVLKSGELNETLWDQNPTRAIHVHRLGLREIEAAKNPRFGVCCRRLIELARQLLQARLAIQPQALVWTGRDEQLRRILELFADSLGKRHALLVIQRARVGSG